MRELIDKLEREQVLSREEFVSLIKGRDESLDEYLFEKSRLTARSRFGNKIFIRGLIEFTNICKNNCYYCGIRAGNNKVRRYRLSREEIMSCCRSGYSLGFRTFVLQGGEDTYFTDGVMCAIVEQIRRDYPDCAITLSLGERSAESYRRLYSAGADRYLLRHETASPEHYSRLHPQEMKLESRMECLHALRETGYQVGCGFMVGSPCQTAENIADDLLFIHCFKPHMIGIGPFIPHRDTPFGKMEAGSLDLTVFLLGILRLMLPNALIPATTAVGTLAPDGRERAILAGANVLMPNLSPSGVRGDYTLYDNKICTGEEAAECRDCLSERMSRIGYELTVARGDYTDN